MADLEFQARNFGSPLKVDRVTSWQRLCFGKNNLAVLIGRQETRGRKTMARTLKMLMDYYLILIVT